MIVDEQELSKELADMEAQRDRFMQSYWQADGACQVLAGFLRKAKGIRPPAPPEAKAETVTEEPKP